MLQKQFQNSKQQRGFCELGSSVISQEAFLKWHYRVLFSHLLKFRQKFSQSQKINFLPNYISSPVDDIFQRNAIPGSYAGSLNLLKLKFCFSFKK